MYKGGTLVRSSGVLIMDSKELREIPVERIRPSPLLLRPLDPRKVTELAESIKAQGLLQPPLVRRDGEMFRIMFGYHRIEACKLLGWQTVPCYVCDMDDLKAFITSEVENI